MNKKDAIVGTIKGFSIFIFVCLMVLVVYNAIKLTISGDKLSYLIWILIPFEILFFIFGIWKDWGNEDGKDK